MSEIRGQKSKKAKNISTARSPEQQDSLKTQRGAKKRFFCLPKKSLANKNHAAFGNFPSHLPEGDAPNCISRQRNAMQSLAVLGVFAYLALLAVNM
jgi:hypothetical protein